MKIKEFIKESSVKLSWQVIALSVLAAALLVLAICQLFSGQYLNGVLNLLITAIVGHYIYVLGEREKYFGWVVKMNDKMHDLTRALYQKNRECENLNALYQETIRTVKEATKQRNDAIDKAKELESKIANQQNHLTMTIDRLNSADAEVAHSKEEIKKLTEDVQRKQNLLQEADRVFAEKDKRIAALQKELSKQQAPHVAKPKRKPAKKANKE